MTKKEHTLCKKKLKPKNKKTMEAKLLYVFYKFASINLQLKKHSCSSSLGHCSFHGGASLQEDFFYRRLKPFSYTIEAFFVNGCSFFYCTVSWLNLLHLPLKLFLSKVEAFFRCTVSWLKLLHLRLNLFLSTFPAFFLFQCLVEAFLSMVAALSGP